jgi:beta-lactamase regulating signal transducer with metallopeptidase domain
MNGSMSLFEVVNEWLDKAFELAVFAGLHAGLLAVVVLVINLFFRRWITAGQMGLLWGVVLLRLLTPYAPGSPLSLENRWDQLIECSTAIRERSAESDNKVQSPPDIAAATAPEPEPTTVPVSTVPAVETNATEETLVADRIVATLPIAWLVGAIICLIWTAVVHQRFSRKLKGATECHDLRLQILWLGCCKAVGIRANISLAQFDGVQQPAIFGLVRPTLLLPTTSAELSDEQLRMIMLHELGHVKRWDIAANWGLVIVRALHWWNPVFWLALARYQSLREQACDAFAVRRIEGQSVRGYGELLLRLAETENSGNPWRVMLPVSMLSFFSTWFRKRTIQNRLKALRLAGIRQSHWHSAGVFGSIVVMAISGLTDASQSAPSKPADPFSSWFAELDFSNANSDANSIRPPQFDPATFVIRSYNVERALERIVADGWTIEEARLELNGMITHLLRSFTHQYHTFTNEWAQERFQFEGNVLTLDVPPKWHAEIGHSLNAWQKSGLGQIVFRLGFIADERDLASAIGFSWRYLEAFSDDRDDVLVSGREPNMPGVRANEVFDDFTPVSVATLNSRQVEALIQMAEARKFDFKITIFNGQRGVLSSIRRRPFVVGNDFEKPQDRRARVAEISEGAKFTCRGVQSGDGTSTRIEACLEASAIWEVQTASTVVAGERRAVQLPRLKRFRVDIVSDVKDGDTLLIGLVPSYDRKKSFYLLVSVHNLSAQQIRSEENAGG